MRLIGIEPAIILFAHYDRGFRKGAGKTGQQIDKIIEKTGEKIEEGGDKVKNSVK